MLRKLCVGIHRGNDLNERNVRAYFQTYNGAFCTKVKGQCRAGIRLPNKESLLAAERKTVFNYGDVIQFLFSGFAVIFVEGLSKAVVYGIQGYDKRSVSEPASEQTIMCAQDSFTETIRTNISLVRRRMKTPSPRV